MPLYCYCPRPECSAKVSYEAIKPTTCPRCKQTFASAFKVAVVASTPSTSPTPAARPKRPTAPALPPRSQAATKWSAKRPSKRPSAIIDDDIEGKFGVTAEFEEETEHASDYPDEVQDLASEIAASLNPDDIIIGDPDGVVRLGRDGFVENRDWRGAPRIQR